MPGEKKKKITRERLTSLVLLTANRSLKETQQCITKGTAEVHRHSHHSQPPLPARANRPRPLKPSVLLKEDQLQK